MHLGEVAEEIQHRIIHIFGRDVEGCRATGNDAGGLEPRIKQDGVDLHAVNE